LSAVIEELKLRNFECYRGAELKFSAGLNLIRGRNSTGKSTLLDALVFALFGEAPDVKPRLLVSRLPGSRDMAVYVRFRSPRTGAVVEVARKGRLDGKGAYRTEERLLRVDGADVHVEGDEDLRARITGLMGANLRKFLNLVYVRQGKMTAILEPPKEQMDSVIGITLLRELREQLDEARRELERYEGRDASTEAENLGRLVIPQLTSNAEQLRKDVEELQSEVQRLDDLVKKGESPELVSLLGRIREKEDAETKIRSTQAKIQELLRSAAAPSPEELDAGIGRLELQLEELAAAKSDLAKEVDGLQGAWSTLKGRADTLEDQIKEHEALLEERVARCPTCGQDLNPAILSKILEEDKNQLCRLRSEQAGSKSIYDRKKSELDLMTEKKVTLENSISALNSMRKDLKRYLDSASSLQEAVEKLLPPIKESLVKLALPLKPEDPELKVKVAQLLPIQPEELTAKKRELGEKRSTLAQKTKTRQELEEKLKRSRDLLVRLKRRIDSANLAKNLSQGFDQGVEARRREFLKRIEFKALQYYKAMTDQHAYSAVTISPDDYSVWVHPRGLTEAVPATRVGGGHQTLLAASVRLALLDALGFRHLLILDEPTYGVDADNLPQLASHLGEVSRQLSQMILVTHHSVCEEEASNIIEVEVREDGASRAEIRLQP
jgi:exonuclease SbcC